MDTCLLEALVAGQPVHPGGERLHHLVGPLEQVVAHRGHQLGVVVHRDAAVTGGQAATHLGEDAGRPLRRDRESVAALPDRERLVQRGQALLRRASRGERAQVVGTVLGHLADQGQARPGLHGELEPVHLLRMAAAAVVARLVRRDQAQLAHPGLQGGGALDPGHRGREVDHLAHPRAALGGGEVGPHPACAGHARSRCRAPAPARRGTGRPRGSAAGARPGAACGVRRGRRGR